MPIFANMKAIIFTICFCLLAVSISFAQGCVTCTNTAAQLGQDSAKGLNAGIVYLASIPLSLIAIVGVIWYKRNYAYEEEHN